MTDRPTPGTLHIQRDPLAIIVVLPLPDGRQRHLFFPLTVTGAVDCVCELMSVREVAEAVAAELQARLDCAAALRQEDFAAAAGIASEVKTDAE